VTPGQALFFAALAVSGWSWLTHWPWGSDLAAVAVVYLLAHAAMSPRR